MIDISNLLSENTSAVQYILFNIGERQNELLPTELSDIPKLSDAPKTDNE